MLDPQEITIHAGTWTVAWGDGPLDSELVNGAWIRARIDSPEADIWLVDEYSIQWTEGTLIYNAFFVA